MLFAGWFGEWGWIAWIAIGVICYIVCSLLANDPEGAKGANWAVVGACILGPVMLLAVYFMWKQTQGGK